MQIVSLGDNLHETSKLILRKKEIYHQFVIAESTKRVVKVKQTHMSLHKVVDECISVIFPELG